VKSLEIRLLGELEVARDGRAIALPASKKTRALFAYLAATARPHLRERLCELLWPGPDDPRAALRWSLTKLRALVDDRGAERIVADRDRVGFEARGARIDLVEVRARLSAGPTAVDTEALVAIAARFRGELLEGLDLPDAFRFHEWLTAEREATRALRLRVLGTLIDRLGASPEAALRAARERVAIDPLSEAAHVAVVRLLTQLGKKREALEQLEACTRILATELHAKPSAALLAARIEIGNASTHAPASAMASAPASASASAPASTFASAMLGRDRERAAIDATLSFASNRVLLFSGEPGIGKSRLLDELASRAAKCGARSRASLRRGGAPARVARADRDRARRRAVVRRSVGGAPPRDRARCPCARGDRVRRAQRGAGGQRAGAPARARAHEGRAARSHRARAAR
jgi:DNA-binding SARP family transcriptional activator